MAKLGLGLIVAAATACGHGGSSAPPPPQRHDAGVTRDAEVAIAARPLGLPALADFAWRKRSGQLPFRAARKAEDRDDWAHVVTSAHDALTADPGHLEAAWLYAVALAKTGKLDQVLAPLQVAAAGDFGKWALASLEQPALQAWLATPTGEAWRRRVDSDRAGYAAALARAIVVTANGDLFAFDPEGARWYRLTRTYGAVVAAFAGPHRIAYVTRTKKKGSAETRVAIGVVDLTTGRSTHPVDVGAAPPIAIAYATAKPAGFWIGTGAAFANARALDDDGKLHALPAKTARPAGAWLEVNVHSARLHRLPIANVSADWDDQSLASAIRVGTSNRVVTATGAGAIDGNTLTWSPDRAQLAFVAQLDDRCTPNAPSGAAFVADAATGAAHELERAEHGLAIEWLSDRKLAVAGDHGVSIYELGAGAPTVLEGADGLVSPRRTPKCTPEPAEEPAEEDEN